MNLGRLDCGRRILRVIHGLDARAILLRGMLVDAGLGAGVQPATNLAQPLDHLID